MSHPESISTSLSHGLYYISPLISSIATLIVGVTYILTGIYKEKLGQITFLIIIGNFLHCFPILIVAFVSASSRPFFCIPWQIMSIYGEISAMLWSTLFAIAILILLKQKGVEIFSKYKTCWLITGLCLPLILALSTIPLEFLDKTDNSACYIKIRQGLYGFLTTIGVPFAISFLVNLYCYWQVYRTVKGVAHSLELILIFLYPIVLVICWVPLIVVYINIMTGTIAHTSVLVDVVQAISYSQGLFHSIIYGVSRKLIEQFKRTFRCCGSRKQENLASAFQSIHEISAFHHTSPLLRSAATLEESLNNSLL